MKHIKPLLETEIVDEKKAGTTDFSFQEHFKKTLEKINKMKEALEELANRQKKDPKNWQIVNDLTKVDEILSDAIGTIIA